MAAPFRERVRLSVYGVRAILRCRGTVPASIGHWLAACPVTASPASWPEPGGCPGGVTAALGAGFILTIPTPSGTETIPAEALLA